MIRNDSVIEFIQYVNRTNYSLKTIIFPTIFETNSFLLNKMQTLIEYSAFFGSIQIFQYLYRCNVEVNSNLWLYAIHGNNPEIIHFIEEIGIEPNIKFIKESIKCNHNEITEYFLNNYPQIFDINWLCLNTGIKYYNFNYFPTNMHISLLFFYLCKYDNYYFVDFILNTSSYVDINFKKTKTSNLYGTFCIHYDNFSYPIGAAAKRMNFDITSLLLNHKDIKINEKCFYECDKLETISIPSSIQKIESNSFNGCSSLYKIVIPNSVKSIESFAFYGCKSLVEIILPNSITSIEEYAFYGCKSLVEIILPNSITSIEKYAFYECSSLKEITIPSSVKEIKESTFFKCTSLTHISIPITITKIQAEAFFMCSSLKNIFCINPNKYILFGCSALPRLTYIVHNLHSIPILWSKLIKSSNKPNKTLSLCSKCPLSESNCKNMTFCCCSSLPQVSIPPFSIIANKQNINENSIFFELLKRIKINYKKISGHFEDYSTSNSIEILSFNGCSSLIHIEIPYPILSIGEWSFEGCSSLTTIIIPHSAKSIEKYAFHECISLKEITIPSSITSIGCKAFKKCYSLEKITFESNSSLNSIGSYSFNKCTSLKEIIIPSSITVIDRGTFAGCSSLSKIVIPDSVHSINPFAFNGCTSLNEIIFPHSLKSIEKCVFKNCKSLKKIVIPGLVEYISNFAFYGCESLSQAIILSSLTRINDFSFPDKKIIIQFIETTKINNFSIK